MTSYKKYDVDLTRVYCLHSAQGINEILGCRNDGMNKQIIPRFSL